MTQTAQALIDPAILEIAPQETVRHPRTVMQITWSFVTGGSEMYALKVAAGLDRSAYRPLMCAIDQGGALEPEIQRLGIRRFVMKRRPGIDLGLMWRLYRLFRHEDVDVIQTHHFNQLFYSLLGAILAGVRIIHTEHSIEAYKKRRLRVALRLMSLFCHRVTVIGPEGEMVLRDRVGIPARKLQMIRAGVDVDQLQGSKAQARREFDLSADDHVAVIIARLYPEKNHRLLLDAFSQVAARDPRARLLIVGDGTEREAIRARIDQLGLDQQVRMLGVRRDVSRILAASDVFILCSDREGLPIAVLEAMAAARPVVATAVGDLPEVIHDGLTGLLVQPGNPDALASAILNVFSNPTAASAMGHAAREVVRQRYGMEAMVGRHEELFRGKQRRD